MLNKLKNKKVSSSILAVIILILILVCSFVLFFEVNDYRKIKSEQHDFYYYFISDRIDFKGNILLSYQDNIMSLENENVTLNSTPVYYKNDSDKMILPENMEIVYPYKNNPMFKIGKFASIYYEGNYLYINSEAGKGRLYDCFFYDGENLYVFIEKTTLIVDGVSYELSPMSYVEATNNYVKIYDRKIDNFVFLEQNITKVDAYTDEYTINLLNDTCTYGNSYYMLIKNVDALDMIEF